MRVRNPDTVPSAPHGVCQRAVGLLTIEWMPARSSLQRRFAAELLLTMSLVLSACDTAAVNNPYAGRAVPTPVTVNGSRQYTRVSAGFFHSCAVTTGGDGWCWGSNEYQQLGAASTPSRCEQVSCSRTPLRVAGSLVLSDIAAGVTSTCALTMVGRTYCWGAGYPGVVLQLGDSALTAGGTALCWGGNQFGQIGNGSFASRATPVVVSSTLRFASISASSTTTCAVAVSGVGY